MSWRTLGCQTGTDANINFKAITAMHHQPVECTVLGTPDDTV